MESRAQKAADLCPDPRNPPVGAHFCQFLCLSFRLFLYLASASRATVALEKNVLKNMAADLFVFPFIDFPLQGHSFVEKEGRCKLLFERALRYFGPFYHLHYPEDHPAILRDQQDYEVAMSIVGMCAFDCPGVRVITFELMSNHVHFIVCGRKEAVLAFFELFKKDFKLELLDTLFDLLIIFLDDLANL